jgi:hypothetical protein
VALNRACLASRGGGDLVSPLERGLRGVLFFNFADISDFAGLTGKWIVLLPLLFLFFSCTTVTTQSVATR